MPATVAAMTTAVTGLHPWLTTPEALEAAEFAIEIPLEMLPVLSERMGPENLLRQALAFLTDHALPPRNLPDSVISRVVGSAHVGSMYEWPADRRAQYATREIGYALNNWVRRHRSAP